MYTCLSVTYDSIICIQWDNMTGWNDVFTEGTWVIYFFVCHCPHDQFYDFGHNLVSTHCTKACTIRKSFSNTLNSKR